MTIPLTPRRYRAISMQLAAYLGGPYVEMHILTDTGKTVPLICEQQQVPALQRHIESLRADTPEIAAWKPTQVAL